MRSRLVLDQNTFPVLRGEGPPSRLRCRINTIDHRWFWGLWIQHDYVRSPPSQKVTPQRTDVVYDEPVAERGAVNCQSVLEAPLGNEKRVWSGLSPRPHALTVF